MMRARLIPASLVSLLLSAIQVTAHGIADGITVYKKGETTGTYYKGYNPSYQYESPPPEVAAWSTPDDLQNGFVAADKYSHPDIICHLGASPASLEVPVNGGDVVAIHWSTWPDSHKGPIIDALAKCDGPCSSADKKSLKFFKIGEQAQLDKAKDWWAPNELIKNDMTWFVTIPETIEPGNYVLRHEIIALHAAAQPGGAQNYPFCFSLAITTTGTDSPEGSEITSWYDGTDKGILWDLFSNRNDDYPIVGPAYHYEHVELAEQRVPKIGATALAIKSLDLASLPTAAAAQPLAQEDPVAVATQEPVVAATPATPTALTTSMVPLMTPTAAAAATPAADDKMPLQPTIIPPAAVDGARKVYTTLRVTTFLTSTLKMTTTAFTTVLAPRPN